MNSKSIIKSGLLAVTVLMVMQSAHALDAVATPVKPNAGQNVTLYGQLDVLRSQNAILMETLKNVELKNQISNGASKSPIGQPNQASGAMMVLPGSTTAGSFSPLSAQVLMVSGVGNHITALISLSNGSSVNAHVGSKISGLGVVKTISLNEVVVATKTQTIALPFAGDPASTPVGTSLATSPIQPMSPMPPMPPMPQNSQGMMSGGGR